MDIVKISNGTYALRKRALFGYIYADKDNLIANRKLHWWNLGDTKSWWTFVDLVELETAIDNYNPKLVKEMAKEKKKKEKDVVIKGGVKFGSKRKSL